MSPALMSRRALITGGAGFIGSHVADELLSRGYVVRVLDALLPQLHGPERRRPAYLDTNIELVPGDVRDRDVVRRALEDVDVVFHFAARIGVGQSMYEVAEYTSVNNHGTAVLLEALISRPVERLVVASSMTIYGEGRYRDPEERVYDHVQRTPDQLARDDWEPRTTNGRELFPVPTPETKIPSIASLYALSKYDQECMCLLVGSAYRIPTVVLRLFNVYGPRQMLANPYTGLLAMFAARLLTGSPPLVFEDGLQRRDFVHVRDVAVACRLALEADAAIGGIFNIGSGLTMTLGEVAERMGRVMGHPMFPKTTGKHQVGDIRHCTADIGLARNVLGYQPQVEVDAGLAELADWLGKQDSVNRIETMRAELAARGLTA
jgi:dTDP-L-rhamnose 4-epimerase